ncbi:MAG: hypothetical protein E7399_00535 [Ruminococcaceae bacterium]|nr:hypothetical protein [Oscillospiraceae bacterium]
MKRSIVLFLLCVCLIIAAMLLPADWFLWNNTPQHWADEEMKQLQQMGVTLPFSRGQWDDPVTRGEFCAFLVNAFSSDTGEEIQLFSDVPAEDPYFSVVNAACRSGWVSQAEFFRPNDFLTRQELLLVCNNLIPLETDSSLQSVATDVEEEMKALVSAAVQSGIFTLYEDNTFRPTDSVTKASAASVICRILTAKKNNDGIRRALLLDYLHAFADGKDASHLCTDQEKERQQYRSKTVLPFFKDKKISKTIKELVLTLTTEGGNADFILCYPDREIKSTLSFTTKQTEQGFLISDTKFRLLASEPIRLVWEYASRPDMEYSNENKANVVSPTWFKLINEKDIEVFPRDMEITENLYLSDYYSHDFFQKAKKGKQQVWALCSNGFEPEQTRQVLADQALRKKLIETLLTKAIDYHLDGINLDFENMYREDKDIFSQFVQECSLYAKEGGLILSADITKIEESSSFYSMCYDREALSRCTDYLMLMAYDQHPKGSNIAGPVAALDWTEDALIGVLEQVPASQMLLGVPFYTRIWETNEGVVVNAPAASMSQVQELMKEKSLTTVWNETEKLHYAEYQEGNSLYKIWIEDTDSCSARMDLIEQYGLSGIACWSGGYETPEIWNLIEKRLK